MTVNLLAVAEKGAISVPDIIAITISIASLLFSIWNALWQNKENRRMKEVDLEAVYFQKILQEYLWEEIPNARDKIKFDENGKIIETGRFQDVVNDTRRKLLYFKYVNEEFYNEVFEILQEMENYVVDSYNKKIVTAEEKTYFYSELNEKMGKFYKIVYDQYHGIKRRNEYINKGVDFDAFILFHVPARKSSKNRECIP